MYAYYQQCWEDVRHPTAWKSSTEKCPVPPRPLLYPLTQTLFSFHVIAAGFLPRCTKTRQCRENLKEVVEETLRTWGSSHGSSSTPQNTGSVPSPSSSGRGSTAAATTFAAGVAAAAATSPPSPSAAPLPAAAATAAASQDARTAAAAANLSSPVTPPRVRKGAETKTAAETAAAVAAADAKPRELTRLEYRIGKCSWRLTMGSKTDHKVKGVFAVSTHSDYICGQNWPCRCVGATWLARTFDGNAFLALVNLQLYGFSTFEQ